MGFVAYYDCEGFVVNISLLTKFSVVVPFQEPADRVKVSVLRLQVSQGSLQPEDAEVRMTV